MNVIGGNPIVRAAEPFEINRNVARFEPKFQSHFALRMLRNLIQNSDLQKTAHKLFPAYKKLNGPPVSIGQGLKFLVHEKIIE